MDAPAVAPPWEAHLYRWRKTARACRELGKCRAFSIRFVFGSDAPYPQRATERPCPPALARYT